MTGRDRFDVEGPVRCEIFVVALVDGELVVTGPDGPGPWHIEVHGEGHPMDEAGRVVESLLPELVLLHSTSWRWDHGSVVLTFIASIPGDAVGDMPSRTVRRVGLARGGATDAPTTIGADQVLEHAIRHLAWLAREDDVVRDKLDAGWHHVLGGYVPTTFGQIETAGRDHG